MLSSGSSISQALSAAGISGRPSRFAGGRRAARCLPSLCRSRFGVSSKLAQAFRASQVEGFGRAGLAVQASLSERFMRPPVSQRLKPQSSMPERFCISPFPQLRSVSAVRWARKVGAHPRLSRHRSKSALVLIRRLTLPSSGPAFGRPLKSNVRAHQFNVYRHHFIR